MADDAVLTADPRTERGSRPAGRLRRRGLVPAVVYGLGTETLEVTVPARELTHILAGGVNTLITLKLDDGEALALARQVQRHPTRGDLVHVDFIRVRADVAVAAEVALHLQGEPAGVLDGGLLEQIVFQVPIEAKPADIPQELTAEVSHLEIGDQIRFSEVRLPPGVTTELEPDTLVAQCIAPRVVEEPEPEEVEGEEGELAEGEEPVEGEAAEGEAPAAQGEGGESTGGGEKE
jgi:large subunit ribosomal protein L25